MKTMARRVGLDESRPYGGKPNGGVAMRRRPKRREALNASQFPQSGRTAATISAYPAASSWPGGVTKT
jgi:hypothetical protein